ncbi:transglycosylase SLT domain-containing protein [Candidatus Berkelbacteria bacterium]|nr:transglycosylase SLT domain-containing protein [Candidatus Berkelbacteria bacterium]
MIQVAVSARTPKRDLFRWAVILGLLGLVALTLWLFTQIFAELRYPLAYESIILQEAEDHDLDPYLVAAVIYSESRFRPDAISPVGARGLMQLMPLTAQGIARRLGTVNFTVDQLYNPEVNIKFGAYHLQGLMGRYNAIEPAIVAYNGGGGAGDRYARGDRTAIPLESLGYVKKVLDAKAKYEELYPARLSGARALNEFLVQESIAEPLANRLLRAVQGAIANKLSK